MANLKDNYCFNVMKNTVQMYWDLITTYENKKENIIETYGENSPEMNEWYKEYNKIAKNNPLNKGQRIAYRAWNSSVGFGHEIIILDEAIWNEEDTNDFIQTLKEAGIKEFIFTNRSSVAMDSIYNFVKNGYIFAGVCDIRCKKKYVDDVIKGIRFKLEDKN